MLYNISNLLMIDCLLFSKHALSVVRKFERVFPVIKAFYHYLELRFRSFKMRFLGVGIPV